MSHKRHSDGLHKGFNTLLHHAADFTLNCLHTVRSYLHGGNRLALINSVEQILLLADVAFTVKKKAAL